RPAFTAPAPNGPDTAASATGCLEAVAKSSNRRDQNRFGRVLFYPRSQALYVHVEGLCVADVVHPPDPVDQGVSGHHPARVVEQHLQQLELLQGKFDLETPHYAFVAADV